jgi:hypothetical protein
MGLIRIFLYLRFDLECTYRKTFFVGTEWTCFLLRISLSV